MKKHLLLLLIFVVVVFFDSCSIEMNEPEELFTSLAKSEEIVKANNQFAFSLFKEIANEETEDNYMISPVSASLALGMVYNGARNETENAFRNTFNYGDVSLEETNNVNQSIINHLTDNASGSLFNIANSLWMRNTFPVKEDFVSLNKEFYAAEVQNLDFNDSNSVVTINNWVSNKTNGKIPTIIDAISREAVLYAINALYFKSDWKYRFDPDKNTVLPFYIDETTTEEVEMMNMAQDLSYFQNDIFSSIIVPYKNDTYNMMILLPNSDKTIGDIVAEMNEENWSNWLDQYSTIGVSLTMPKFTFSYEKKLNNMLINLGLGVAFTGQADFSGISDIPTLISFVLQKTFIEVNEKGTEAAAVTIVGAELTSIGTGSREFLLNKPFLFLITEKTTGSICFMGKVGKP